MIVFSGLIACLTFTLLAGWAWPTRHHISATHALVDGIAKSLWLAWILVAVGYLGHLPGTELVWCAIVALLLTGIIANRKRMIFIQPYELFMLLLVAVLAAWRFGKMVVYGVNGYTRVFADWDALVSWNRWAVELYSNGYGPVAAAYPILFPGIWSLIYRAQATPEIWFIAKLSLFILPLLFLLSLVLLWKHGHKIAALAGVIFFDWFFLGIQQPALFTGWMDGPVALLLATCAVFIVPLLDAIDRDDIAYRNALLTTLATLAGITAITKQAGIFGLLMFALLLALLVHHRYLALRKAGALLFIAAIPYLLFYAMFHKAGQVDVLGNYSYLAGLVEETAQQKNRFLSALNMLSEKKSGFVIALLVCVSLRHFLHMRTLRGQIGLVFLVLTGIGFVIYAHCCAYSPRNGWWLISTLAGSALLATTFPRKTAEKELPLVQSTRSIPAHWFLFPMLVCSLVFSATAGIFIRDQDARTLQETAQWRIVSPALATLLQTHLPTIGDEDILISPDQSIAWLPNMRGRYCSCTHTEPNCVTLQRERANRTFILVHCCKEHFMLQGLNALLTKNKMLGEADGYMLYGPFP